MTSLGDKMEENLAGVLSLCNVTQEDVDAVQRHDDAAIALLEVNERDAKEALTPWISCLEAWGRLHRQEADIETSNEGNPGPWPIITQPASTILAKFSSTDDTRPSNAPSLPAHKALTVILYRVMLLGDEVQGSPHRTPVVAAWVAGRAYLLMLALPGAGAYGILQPAVFGLVLSNVRSWCRTSNIHRPGSVSGKSGAEDSTAVVRSSADGGGKSHGLQKRRRGGQAIGSPEADSDADSENEEVEAGRKGRRAATLALLKRGGTNGNSAAGSGSEVYACIELVKACLASVPLASHQDLVVKLSEILVGVSVIAAVEGPAELVDLASSTTVSLATAGATGHNGNATLAAVLQALMPVILMASGKDNVPPRSKDCLRAHDHAVGIVKSIASALRSAAREHASTRRSFSCGSSGGAAGNHAEDQQHSSPVGDKAVSSRGDEQMPSPTGDGSNASPVQSDDGNISVRVHAAGADEGDSERRQMLRPILTMLQHLCVSAPERAERRARLAGGILAVLVEMEGSERGRFVSFLGKFSRSARILHRGFAVELSSRLLTEDWPWGATLHSDTITGNNDEENDAVRATDSTPATRSSPTGDGDVASASPGLQDRGGKTMLGLVVSRAGDSAPTVRSKAASTLAEVLSGIQGRQSGYTSEPLRIAIMEACWWRELGSRGNHGGPLLNVVRTMVQDEKANVRRNAVPALEALLTLSPAFGGGAIGAAPKEGGAISDGSAGRAAIRNGRNVTVDHAGDFLLLEERCNDVSLATRKAAMSAMSALLISRPSDEYLQSAWVAAVLPLASDPEQTCQNRLVELVRTVLLDRVVDWHRAEIVSSKANKHDAIRKGLHGERRGRSETHASKDTTEAVGDEDGSVPGAQRVSSVWALLAKAGQGDAHKCLKKVVSILMAQKDSGFKSAPVLKALRSAAVMALPPNASKEGVASEDGTDSEEADQWEAEDLRLLSLADDMPRAALTTIRRGTWALLEAFLDRAPSPGNGVGKNLTDRPDMDPMFVVRCWNRIRGHILQEALSRGEASGDNELSSPDSEEAFESDGRRVLGVLARLARSVPADVATPLAEGLLEMLLDLVALPETSAALVSALHMLCFAKADTEEAGAAMCNAWANHALSSFEGLLDLFVYQGSGSLQDHAGARACGFDMARLVERLLFAVGEVVVVGFTGKEDAAGPSDPRAPDTSAAASVAVRPTPSARMVKLVQVLLPPRLPKSAHGVEEGEESPATPSAVRALAFVTLGKLCLRNKELAKSSVNIFVRELDTADDPAVRSNALIVLGDLCVRYTAMVDRHVGAMAACLQDAHPMVRRHAILLISQLLLQDYVKWRGLLLHRFLATLVDSDASVRDLGLFTLTRPLINKIPGLFAQNFVETLFVLNNYSEHPCYAAAAAGRADVGGGVTMEGIDLGGDSPAQVRKRMTVYSTMLEYMSDEQKITVTAKLAQEVLSAAIDGGLPLANGSAASPETRSAAFPKGNKVKTSVGKGAELEARTKASAVVRDALTVMASPRIRVGGRGGGGAGAAGDVDDGSEDMGSQSGGLAAAKSKLLSKLALKHSMEIVVPILTALKHVLERAHSPLLKELMAYFGELFRSHKEEVKAVLACEAGLVEEIDFDLRRFEKEEQDQRKAKQAAAAAAAAAAMAAANNMCPPRTPRGRRSSVGGGALSGRRDPSSGPGMRAPKTPMGAVMRSARKTPSQNLGDCSTVRLKAAAGASVMFSPALARGVETGTRGPRPKTPLQLRTPREAVAAALGNSPMLTSPLPMRSMLGSEEKAQSSASDSFQSRNRGVGGADIELTSPISPHPAKRRRWSVSVAPPPEAMVDNGDRSEPEEQEGVPAEERLFPAPPSAKGADNEMAGTVAQGEKENNPIPANATSGGKPEKSRSRKSAKAKTDGKGGDLGRLKSRTSDQAQADLKASEAPAREEQKRVKNRAKNALKNGTENGAAAQKSRSQEKEDASIKSEKASTVRPQPSRRSSRAAKG